MSATLTNAELHELKARAQRLEPVVKIGHAGVTEALVRSLDAALTAHQLVKVKFTAFKDEKKILAPQLAGQTGSELIQRVGNVAVYFRRRPAPAVTGGNGSI